jgi:hypothetical protein
MTCGSYFSRCTWHPSLPLAWRHAIGRELNDKVGVCAHVLSSARDKRGASLTCSEPPAAVYSTPTATPEELTQLPSKFTHSSTFASRSRTPSTPPPTRADFPDGSSSASPLPPTRYRPLPPGRRTRIAPLCLPALDCSTARARAAQHPCWVLQFWLLRLWLYSTVWAPLWQRLWVLAW